MHPVIHIIVYTALCTVPCGIVTDVELFLPLWARYPNSCVLPERRLAICHEDSRLCSEGLIRKWGKSEGFLVGSLTEMGTEHHVIYGPAEYRALF